MSNAATLRKRAKDMRDKAAEVMAEAAFADNQMYARIEADDLRSKAAVLETQATQLESQEGN